MKKPMTRTEARKAINTITTQLDKALDASTSQFQIRLNYITAYEDMTELARKLVNDIREDDHK